MVIDQINGTVRVTDSCFYPVRKSSKILLSVDVGDFQAGGSNYSWGEEMVVGTPNFTETPINSPGQPLHGAALHCTTKVMDIRPETNRTSVMYTLQGGLGKKSFPYAIQTLQEHGSALYQITFVFIIQDA